MLKINAPSPQKIFLLHNIHVISKIMSGSLLSMRNKVWNFHCHLWGQVQKKNWIKKKKDSGPITFILCSSKMICFNMIDHVLVMFIKVSKFNLGQKAKKLIYIKCMFPRLLLQIYKVAKYLFEYLILYCKWATEFQTFI